MTTPAQLESESALIARLDAALEEVHLDNALTLRDYMNILLWERLLAMDANLDLRKLRARTR